MDATIPWVRWVGLIEPHYYSDGPGKQGPQTRAGGDDAADVPVADVVLALSDEGAEDGDLRLVCDAPIHMGLDFAAEHVPDATTLTTTMAAPDRAAESRKASVRAKVEHPFLIVKRDFGFTKTRYRGITKNLNHLHMLFARANWLMRTRAVALTG